MNEEQFDVVDEHDNVIGRAARSVVHAKRWLHRAVHIFVLNSAGELLVHLRSATRDEFPLKWTSSASGHVSAGETYDDSAPRELAEELGLAAPLTRLHKFAACEATANEHTVLYVARSDESPTLQVEEIAAGEFLPIPEIQRQLDESPDRFTPPFRMLFQWFVEQRLSRIP
ncbi:MAG: NUDIX domain-containing protein [Planctomycetota bacterium]|nr:NUDIX domain-containing protein [Planctomycetota bacterium]